jgi:hypothetical protein
MKKIYLLSFLTFGISTVSNSQVIYTDVIPDLTFTADQQYFLDMDNDNNDDYIIEQVDSVLTGNPLEGVQLRSIGSLNEAVYETATLTFLASIPLNSVIDNTMLWTVPAPSLPAGGVITIGSSDFPAGDWADGLDHYASLRFTTSSNQYYGWVRFSVATDGLSFTIKDYAYHNTKGVFLLAGSTVDGVEENEITEFSLQQLGTTLLIQNQLNFNNTIEVFDLSGKLVKTENMNSNLLMMNLSHFNNGIYIIRCSNENGIKDFKVVLTK